MTRHQALEHLLGLERAVALYTAEDKTNYDILSPMRAARDRLKEDIQYWLKPPSERKRRKK